MLLPASPQLHLSLRSGIWLTLRQTGPRYRQAIGWFGWVDIPSPHMVYVVWTAALAGFSAFGLAMSSRCRRALPLLVILILAMPVILESPKINTAGPYWQGRYSLPLLVGVPLVASVLQPRRPHQRSRWLARPLINLLGLLVLGAVLFAAQLAAFLTALHRYQTGVGAAPGSPVRWFPPGGTVFVVSLFIIGQVLLLGFIGWKSFERRGLPPTSSIPTTSYSVVEI